MGATFTSSGSSVVPTSGEVVLSEMVEPVTLTVSLAAPGVSEIVMLDIFAISTNTVVWLFLNPEASTLSEYSPGIRLTTLNVPAEDVTVLDTTPVELLVSVTRAPLTTAWLGSTTVPLIPL